MTIQPKALKTSMRGMRGRPKHLVNNNNNNLYNLCNNNKVSNKVNSNNNNNLCNNNKVSN